MADLEQIEENNKLVMGWYGSCDNEPCSDFPLKTQGVYDVIESVYEISTDTWHRRTTRLCSHWNRWNVVILIGLL